MMPSFVFCLFVLFIRSSALIEWPFESRDYYKSLNLTVGTPGWCISTALEFVKSEGGLFIPMLDEYNQGYVFKNSSTFSITDFYLDRNEAFALNATDRISIQSKDGKNVTFAKMPIRLDSDYDSPSSNLYLAPLTKNGSSFLDKLLESEEEKIAVLTYKNITHGKYPYESYDEYHDVNGILTLGGRPEICSKNWTMVPDVQRYYIRNPWNFEVGLKIDNFTYPRPLIGTFERSENNHDQYSYQNDPYNTIVIKMTEKWDSASVPCNSTKKIVFTVGGKELVWDPEDYLVNRSMFWETACYIRKVGGEAKDHIVLPLSLLRNRCLMYDFKNKQIGLADKVERN